MDVRAKARYVRVSPRKVRLVLDAVRNLNPEKAVIHLSLMPQKAARPVRKLISSAIANAENNFKLNKGDLQIKSLVADEGPTLKRWRPRAFGRAAMIRKRTSHISVILTDGKEEAVEKKEVKKDVQVKADEKKDKEVVEKKTTKKPENTKKKTVKEDKKLPKKETKTENKAKKETKKSEKSK